MVAWLQRHTHDDITGTELCSTHLDEMLNELFKSSAELVNMTDLDECQVRPYLCCRRKPANSKMFILYFSLDQYLVNQHRCKGCSFNSTDLKNNNQKPESISVCQTATN